MTTVRMGADERRELVVKAALTEFARSGFSGTSTEAIAKRPASASPTCSGSSPPRRISSSRSSPPASTASTTRSWRPPTARSAWRQRRPWRRHTPLCSRTASCSPHRCTRTPRPTTRRSRRRPATAFRRLWLLVQRASGLPDEGIVQFFAVGMLINVAASLDLPHLKEPWAQGLLALTCPDMIID